MEEFNEKPFYKNSINQRCAIFVNAFHEWKWLDSKEKQKDNHFTKVKNQPIFSIGGIYNLWTNPANDERIMTCTVGTTDENPVMT